MCLNEEREEKLEDKKGKKNEEKKKETFRIKKKCREIRIETKNMERICLIDKTNLCPLEIMKIKYIKLTTYKT